MSSIFTVVNYRVENEILGPNDIQIFKGREPYPTQTFFDEHDDHEDYNEHNDHDDHQVVR